MSSSPPAGLFVVLLTMVVAVQLIWKNKQKSTFFKCEFLKKHFCVPELQLVFEEQIELSVKKARLT